jgi:glycosyltransferase involved in cell wall biosynthesis/GT2 family glycosyltransferase
MQQSELKQANNLLRVGKYDQALQKYYELLDIVEYKGIKDLILQNIEIALRRSGHTLSTLPSRSHRNLLKNCLNVGSYFSLKRRNGLNSLNSQRKICLVTDELAGIPPAGGIGAAFLELARVLSSDGFEVDVLYCQARYVDDKKFPDRLKREMENVGARFFVLNPYNYTTPAFTPSKISYAIYKWLEERDGEYSTIHFHDYKGLAFFPLMARVQSLALLHSHIVVQIHGPSRWALEANSQFYSHPEQIRIDYLERASIELADYIVAPSNYILNWIESNGFQTHNCKSKYTIPNCLPSETPLPPTKKDNNGKGLKTIIFFGRHEQRKGLRIFCDAINIIQKELTNHGIKVVFLGGLGEVNDAPSLFHLEKHSETWEFDCELVTNLTRDDALAYILKQVNPVVCICSPYENSPYTVFEIMNLQLPLIASNQGGAIELFSDPEYPGLIKMNPCELARVLLLNITSRLPAPASANTASSIAQKWRDFHNEISENRESSSCSILRESKQPLPLISVVIAHYERPKKLQDAVKSILAQDYPRIELIVVDDGSSSPETKDFLLNHIGPILKEADGKLVFRENGYLGAARNTGLKKASGKYICFLDDDDFALPNMLSDLFIATLSTNADFVVALNTYMPLPDRELFIKEKNTKHVASYIPTGGPHSLGCLENCFGAATGLFNTEALLEIGGYSEIKGVGHEDYELYTKISSKGKMIWIIPRVLYFYEVGRPSMLSNTSLSENFARNHSEFIVDQRSQDLVNMLLGQKLAADKATRMAWKMSGRNHELIQIVFRAAHDRDKCLKAYLTLLEFENKTESKIYQVIKCDLNRSL